MANNMSELENDCCDGYREPAIILAQIHELYESSAGGGSLELGKIQISISKGRAVAYRGLSAILVLQDYYGNSTIQIDILQQRKKNKIFNKSGILKKLKKTSNEEPGNSARPESVLSTSFSHFKPVISTRTSLLAIRASNIKMHPDNPWVNPDVLHHTVQRELANGTPLPPKEPLAEPDVEALMAVYKTGDEQAGDGNLEHYPVKCPYCREWSSNRFYKVMHILRTGHGPAGAFAGRAGRPPTPSLLNPGRAPAAPAGEEEEWPRAPPDLLGPLRGLIAGGGAEEEADGPGAVAVDGANSLAAYYGVQLPAALWWCWGGGGEGSGFSLGAEAGRAGALLGRKVLLFLEHCERPWEVQVAAGGLWASAAAVVATLKVRYAACAALGVGLGNLFRPAARRLLEPALGRALGRRYRRWAPVLVGAACQAAGLALAWLAQRAVSALQGGLRGGQLFARHTLSLAKRAGHFRGQESALEELLLGLAVAGAGVWFQLTHLFGLPFPWNVLLLPLRVVEAALVWVKAW
uniref:Uncharacterized protein n=2 Tax=Heterosigma akashiwo TaxID=2829 RepID=A0A7S3XZP1_HETAK